MYYVCAASELASDSQGRVSAVLVCNYIVYLYVPVSESACVRICGPM